MLVFLALLASSPLAPRLYFVSPSGNDAWTGRLARPDRRGRDGPFATIAAARDVLRKLPRTTPATVEIEPGIYRITQPIVFGPEDSGSVGAERIFSGDSSHGGALLSGMRRITGWKRLPNGWLQAHVPAVESGAWNFCQLFVNGERRYRPRLPKSGYYTIAGKVAPTEAAKGHGYDRFGFDGDQIRSDWANRDDVEILGFHIWGMSRNRIAAVDDAQRVVTFKAPTGYDDAWADFRKGGRFLVENVKKSLSQAGEWYLDRPSGLLTYIPKPGEQPDGLDIEAPVAESLIEVRGDLEHRSWVSHLTIRGLRLEGSNWNLPPNGRNFPQAEADLPGAVRVEGARDCDIGGNVISHTGAYGIELGAACKRVGLQKNVLTDLGAGGIKIGQMEYVRDPELLTEKCQAGMNLVLSGGRIHPAAVGIWVGQNPFIEVWDNYIRDFYYTGISVGWSWGYQPNGAHHDIIRGNRISLIGQGVLSDMGGIYTLGPQPGSVISGNRIHDVQSFSYGGWGIYPDEGSTGLLIENNCVYRTTSAGFHQHYGKDNVIRNNVFAFGGEAQVMRTRAEDHLSFTFDHDIVVFSDGALLGSNWNGNNYKLDHNLYWRLGGKPFDFAGMSFEQWRAKGQDQHSLIADPLVVDPLGGDFRLRPGSPTLGLGFKRFPALDPSFDAGTYRPPPRAFP